MPTPLWLLRTTGWRGRFISVGLGGLAVLGQAPFHLWIITLLSLALLLTRLKWAAQYAPSPRAGFGAAFWWALGYFLIGTSWIGSAFIARGPAFIPLMPPMILMLGSALAFFWGLSGAAFVWMHRHKGTQNGLAALSFISLFWLAEYVRGHIFGGFPWNLLGYIFEAGGPISQAASIFGVYGLSWIVLICAAALEALRSIGQARGRQFGLIGAGFILISGSFGYGLWRTNQAQIDYVEDVQLRIAHVRFLQKDKFDPQKSVQIVNNFLAQSLAPGVENITHIIWPEGAVNGLAIEDEALMQAMGAALISYDETPPVWLLNSLRHEKRLAARGEGAVIDDYYNSSVAVIFDSQGRAQIAAYNDKRRLVPFGEFIPGGKWMEERKIPVISTSLLSISPAKTKTLADFPGLPRLSAQICYEIIFSGFTTRIKNTQSAQFILNQSNDAWYGDSIGPMQHANMSRYRAIEEGLPVVRAASNGVSGIVSPYGSYLAKAGPRATAFIDSPLPKPLSAVFFSKIIYTFLVLINLLISLCCTLLLQGIREGSTALSVKSFNTFGGGGTTGTEPNRDENK